MVELIYRRKSRKRVLIASEKEFQLIPNSLRSAVPVAFECCLPKIPSCDQFVRVNGIKTTRVC